MSPSLVKDGSLSNSKLHTSPNCIWIILPMIGLKRHNLRAEDTSGVYEFIRGGKLTLLLDFCQFFFDMWEKKEALLVTSQKSI
mmetsp:Transcript_6118/g.8917  ORF Transcript_6118/g.8917 Transcript_6118/m.8917 type:complete len:83 (-) Transcript_6118:306-554(-)